MKKIISVLFLCPFFAVGQNEVIAVIDKNTNPGEVIDELPIPPPKLEGSLYLFDDWITGDVFLKNNKVLKGYPIRYDLKNQLLEINASGEIKVCQLPLLKSFAYKEPIGDSIFYHNTSEVNNITYDLPKGVCQILLDGKIKLVKYEYIEIKEATYNVALSMGERNDKALKKSKIFALVNDNVFAVKGSIKKNETLFKDNLKEIENFVKKNKLKLKNESHLIRIFQFYQELI